MKESIYGYIVDCIDINNQPPFDHPLLKNHRLQEVAQLAMAPPAQALTELEQLNTD
ncbi:unnamed protein product [Lupinus luteus]|uniref:Neprosin activation peptide domain-containing protein n=1 Tax=Lupinus luteus TaxID=3873 RepID=A0AAV1WFI0_LUPLU